MCNNLVHLRRKQMLLCDFPFSRMPNNSPESMDCRNRIANPSKQKMKNQPWNEKKTNYEQQHNIES